MDSTLHNNAAKFWGWFSTHSGELAAPSPPAGLIEGLEEQLFAISRFDWEIGPGRKEPWQFALSPRGERSVLQLTKEVISQAPELPGWEFYPAKQPRRWDLIFELDINGNKIRIDGKKWQFVVYKFDDGTYDLLLKPDSRHEISDNNLNWAATIIADGELGEERRMNLLGCIEVVNAWGENEVKSARLLEPGLLAESMGQQLEDER